MLNGGLNFNIWLSWYLRSKWQFMKFFSSVILECCQLHVLPFLLLMYVCVCVCLYPSSVKASFVCNDVLVINKGTDQWSCVEGIILDASAKSLHLSFWICHISSPKTKFRPIHNRKENDKRYAPLKRWFMFCLLYHPSVRVLFIVTSATFVCYHFCHCW